MIEPDLLRHLSELSAKIDRLTPPAPPAIVTRDLATRFMASTKFQSLKAAKSDEGRFRLHLLRLLGDVPVMELRSSIDGYRDQRRVEALHRRKKPTRPATRNREVLCLSSMCTWAVEERIIPSNPLAGISMEPEENVRRTMPTAEDVQKLLFSAKSRRLRAMIATKFASGLRRGELCKLLRTQAFFDEGLIVLSAIDTKTKRPRITVMTELASRLVQEYFDERTADSPYLFCTESGRPVSPRNFLRDYQKTCEEAGVNAAEGERCWLHDLRAGFVGRQLELSVPERTIMDMGGWRTHHAFDRYVRVQRRWVLEAKARADLADAKRKDPQRSPRKTVDSETPRLAFVNGQD